MDGKTIKGTGLKQLVAASHRITSHLEMDSVLGQIVTTLTSELGALYAVVWLAERGDICHECEHTEECLGGDECLHLKAWDGPHDPLLAVRSRVPMGVLRIADIAKAGAPYITDDLKADPLLIDGSWVTEQGVESFAGFPLVYDGRLLGVLAYFGDRPLDPEMGDILSCFAHHCSIAIEDSRQHRRLLMSEERYRALIDGAIDAVLIFGAEGDILNASLSASHMLGYNKDAVLMMNIKDIDMVSEDGMSTFFNDMEKGGVITYETTFVTASGDPLAVEVRAGAIKYGGETAIQAFIRDVTDRKKLERQKADLISMLTHDLKGPLSIILGYAEVIKGQYMGTLPDFVNEGVESIQHSGEKLLSMINDYLNLSRMEAGMLSMDKGPVALPALLNRAMDTVVFKAEQKSLKVTLHCHTDLPEILADGKHLERAVANLLLNAVSYTPRGGSITVDCHMDSLRKVVEIRVSDTGMGISHEEMPKVFDKYYRSGSNTGKGFGLGLAIVKAVVEGHGGTVSVESELGQGSSFTITLPV